MRLVTSFRRWEGWWLACLSVGEVEYRSKESKTGVCRLQEVRLGHGSQVRCRSVDAESRRKQPARPCSCL